jgi:hypothetical protein
MSKSAVNLSDDYKQLRCFNEYMLTCYIGFHIRGIKQQSMILKKTFAAQSLKILSFINFINGF